MSPEISERAFEKVIERALLVHDPPVFPSSPESSNHSLKSR